jgi:hypothetical protein
MSQMSQKVQSKICVVCEICGPINPCKSPAYRRNKLCNPWQKFSIIRAQNLVETGVKNHPEISPFLLT